MTGNGVTPTPGRLIKYASPVTNEIHDLRIVEFVVLKSMETLQDEGAKFTNNEEEAAAVHERSGAVSAWLISEGWFTADEWAEAIVQDEVANMDEELRSL